MRSTLREVLVLVVVFGLLLGGLFVYTKNWPPAVIVESGSMMHADSEVTFGRLGTIDPGDLVLVKRIARGEDVGTLVEEGGEHYGAAGEVIVFYSAGDRARTPIIHRAVAYVDVDEATREYRVRWSAEAPCVGGAVKETSDGVAWCTYATGITIPSLGLDDYRPIRSGFLTKGDNPVTNRGTDQVSGIARDENGVASPVPIEWVEGAARAELPWVGLVKLALAGKPNQDHPPGAWVQIGWASAPQDLWIMLGITLAALVGVPLAMDGYRAFRARQAKRS